MSLFIRTEMVSQKKLVGHHIQMSLIENRTQELWKYFMQNRKAIDSSLGNSLYSIQVYNKEEHPFTPQTVFTKWAATDVSNYSNVPSVFEKFTLTGGLYAIFLHKGLPTQFQRTFHFIFSVWLPNSEYVLDQRPHFEVLGNKYSNTDPDSEEEVWVPVKINSNRNL